MLQEVVLPLSSDRKGTITLGDDCASVRLERGHSEIAITSDPAPKPLVWDLDSEPYRTWGWYSVLINVSDLAAAGVDPIAFTSSVEAPPDLLVADFQSFFCGIADACKKMGIANAGGNIRAASKFGCHGTAIGGAQSGEILRRSGCKPGDEIFAIGSCGQFISAFLRANQVGLADVSESERTALVRPAPKVREMSTLRRASVVSAASDNSDGVLGAIWNICERSICGVELELSEKCLPLNVKQAASSHNLDPWNLMYFWGDWQVIVTVPPERVSELRRLADQEQIPYTRLGRAIDGEPRITGRSHRRYGRLKILRNENFIKTSYNTASNDHVEYMLRTDLFE
ncbi:MAG: thiamine-phosphate kinase [Candidatus Zixiibacteriota bacterium]